mmetsp:Transcript_59992/g.105000  ORF Transcript_59992/g.105000 Transcript_59992/m.105000 type:complete len:389 (+) Transcript_59992:47-1213(+)
MHLYTRNDLPSVILVLWLILAFTATGAASETRVLVQLNKIGAGSRLFSELHEDVRMQNESDSSHDWDTAFSPCPRDTVEKHFETKDQLSADQKIRVDEAVAAIHLAQPEKQFKIGCAFKASSSDRQKLLDTVQTWAKKCDKILAFSDETWQLPGPWGVTTIAISVPGGDTYDTLGSKTQAIMQHLASTWEQEAFDFVVMSDTDTFFVMENLQAFLASSEIQGRRDAGIPILLGDLWMDQQGLSWVSGGGYVISRKVVDAVISCDPLIKQQCTGAEDVMVSRCLQTSAFQYSLLNHGPCCDMDGKDRFTHYSISQLNAKFDVSSALIMFHHTVGEERYRFHQNLYKDLSPRLCADQSLAAVGEYQIQDWSEHGRREEVMRKYSSQVPCP